MANKTQSAGQSSSNKSSSNGSHAVSAAVAADADEAAPVSNAASLSTAGSEEQTEPLSTFHLFPRLPPEIKNMILEVRTQDVDQWRGEVQASHFTKTSEFKELMKLGGAIPDFKSFIEHKFGAKFESLRGNVHLALRGNQDILALDMRLGMPMDWEYRASGLFRRHNAYGVCEPGIRNIGVYYNGQRCKSLACMIRCWPHVTNNSREHLDLPFCPYELAMLSKNFSHIQNVFVLIVLKPNHFVRHETAEVTIDEVKEWVRRRQGEARQKSLAVFQDQQRTWVEIKNVKGVNDQLVSSITEVFNLLNQTKNAFNMRHSNIKDSVVPRQDVGFRVLASNFWMK
ncbi:hypothetical protein CGCSCA4_v003753 [Colletotrichum siamense]|uniref:Uncharacterized protein n=1 Tax=Colletotrichum siamense TaxID=690259 RepID=A0A9P5EXR1_COLSI|nr:hypothetical protein CGCSCA4_v003753 [Colletotrichum siamense]KAF4862456.1 hypothetical protein CGCSCA2_v003499 [Colletotrichum siamense]